MDEDMVATILIMANSGLSANEIIKRIGERYGLDQSDIHENYEKMRAIRDLLSKED